MIFYHCFRHGVCSCTYVDRKMVYSRCDLSNRQSSISCWWFRHILKFCFVIFTCGQLVIIWLESKHWCAPWCRIFQLFIISCCLKLWCCILQIVSVDFSTSGGKARPRKAIKPVPGKGRKKEKSAKADKWRQAVMSTHHVHPCNILPVLWTN